MRSVSVFRHGASAQPVEVAVGFVSHSCQTCILDLVINIYNVNEHLITQEPFPEYITLIL